MRWLISVGGHRRFKTSLPWIRLVEGVYWLGLKLRPIIIRVRIIAIDLHYSLHELDPAIHASLEPIILFAWAVCDISLIILCISGKIIAYGIKIISARVSSLEEWAILMSFCKHFLILIIHCEVRVVVIVIKTSWFYLCSLLILRHFNKS